MTVPKRCAHVWYQLSDAQVEKILGVDIVRSTVAAPRRCSACFAMEMHYETESGEVFIALYQRDPDAPIELPFECEHGVRAELGARDGARRSAVKGA